MAKRRLGKLSWLAVTRSLVRLNLNQLERCADEVQDTLGKGLHEFERHVEIKAKKMQADVREEWYEWNVDRHWELSEVFPKIVRHSMFVTSYAFLEHALCQLTTGLAREVPKAVVPQDLKGDAIDLARAYLKKVQRVAFPDQSAEWNRLSYYRKIRNCLVHDDGRVGQGARGQAIQKYLQQNPGLGSLDQFGRISLEPAACQDIIQTVRSFLNQLFDNVQARQDRRRRAKPALKGAGRSHRSRPGR